MNSNQSQVESTVVQNHKDISNEALNHLTFKDPLIETYVNGLSIRDLYLAIAHYVDHVASNESDHLATLRTLIEELMRRAQTGEFSDREILDEGMKLIYHCLGLGYLTVNDRQTWINNLVKLVMKKDYDGGDSPSKDLFDCWYKVSESLKLRSETESNAIAYYLDTAIQCLRTTVTLAEIDTANYTKANRMLGDCLLARYDRNRNPDDFNEGTRCSMTCEKMPDEDKQNVAERVRNLFKEELNEKELTDDIEKYRDLLKANFDSQSDSVLADVHFNLGTALSLLFKISGGITQLNESIMHLGKAVELSPDDGMANLALALASVQKLQLKEHWTLEMFEEVKNQLNKAMSLLPFNIGGISERMFGMLNPSSLQDTVSRMQDITPVTRNPFDKAVELAQKMRSFYSVTGDVKYLDYSISHAHEAVDLCPDGYSTRYMLYFNLAEAQFTMYQSNKNVDDLNDSIQSYEICLEILPSSNYLRAEYLIKFAEAKEYKHQLRYQEGISPSESRKMAVAYMKLYKAAGWEATSSPVIVRIFAAMKCAVVVEHEDRELASKAYNKVLYFLPRLSLLGTSFEDRYQDTVKKVKTDGYSSKAALNEIVLGKFGKAIESLEAGRAVFWQQALNLRIPTDALREANPILEERFSKICAELSGASRSNVKDNDMIHRLGILNKDLEDVLDEIHKLDGFTDFLLPQKLNNLQKSLKYPAVYLIPDDNGSHALILLPNDVKHVMLPDAPFQELLRNVRLLPVSSSNTENLSTFRERSVAWDTKRSTRYGRVVSRVKVSPLKEVLNFLWKNVVLLIITALELTQESDHKTRLFWCPTGIFSFLPLHAAGIYNDDMTSKSCTFDYFISSYAPTAAAITNEHAVKFHAPFKMMVVVDPTELPYSVDEMNKIEQNIPSDLLLKFGTSDPPALVETIASKMSEVSIVHFACHGTQLMDKPLNSYLKLHDGGLTISRIMEQHMPNAALAFLCACESAMGDQALPDEAIHLGASLLFSGFRSVVGTMWPIYDNDGPVFANTVYAHLMKDNATVPNTELTAEGVHLAMAELRKRGVDFEGWVPFIHIGN